MEKDHFEKLALFCNVRRELVFEEQDVANTIYEVPLELARQDLDKYILELLELHVSDLVIDDWRNLVQRVIHPGRGQVKIAVVGKYITLRDAYKSIYEALTHGAIANDVKLDLLPIDSEDLEKEGCDVAKALAGCDGVLVPGGFGTRGIKGKIMAIRHAREQRVPFFGICLGMQCAVIEFAQHICGLPEATSTEFDKTTREPVITMMDAQQNVVDMGGTMRLGAWPCTLTPGSHAAAAYGCADIRERHRHRYEFNPRYVDGLRQKGMLVAGASPDGKLVELIELPGHPWFVACQFHPEFKSRPLAAHPLFRDFIKAAVAHRDGK